MHYSRIIKNALLLTLTKALLMPIKFTLIKIGIGILFLYHNYKYKGSQHDATVIIISVTVCSLEKGL